jgi:hypothetical protein
MNQHDERRIDNMVESLVAQIDLNGPQMKNIAATGDARALMPMLFAAGHVIEELWAQIGRLDARLNAIDGEE